MNDIVFVVPQWQAYLGEEFNGTLLLATILKQNKLNVDIYRFYEADKSQGFSSFVEKTAKNILNKCPKIISFYCRCDCYLANIMIAKAIKQKSPDTYIVFGGPQSDVSANDTLSEISWVDFCCRGEGENTVLPLFSALLKGEDYSKIDGLSFRDIKGNIIENPVAPLVENLDTLPYLDYSLVPEDTIKNTTKNNLSARLDVGRGCPYKCAYCSTSIFWQRKFRVKSANRILDEMLRIYDIFGITKFFFEHDLFTASKKRVLEFTSALKNCKTRFMWACSSRVDTLDEETIAEMAGNGLRKVYLGVESGSERIQKLMNKNLEIEDIINTVSLLKKYNINVTASFMYGIPEETEEDIEKTLQLVYKLYKLGVDKFQFHLCSITQGTPYYYQYLDKLTLTLNQSDQVGDFGFEECKDFIQEHVKLFSFCYEYKSETRDKFTHLNTYALPTIKTYDNLCMLLPNAQQDIKLTELLLELEDIHTTTHEEISSFDAALAYINKHSI